VQCVANERMTAEVGRSSVDDEPTDAADETPLSARTSTDHTHVSVSADVQRRASADLNQSALYVYATISQHHSLITP